MSYSSAKTENRGSFVLTQLMGRYRAAVKIEGPEKAYVTTRKEFHAFLDTYSGQACGRFGRLAFAHICYRAGKLDAAASLYAQAMKDFPNSRMIKDMAACGLGYCYEEKGEYKKAVGLFKSVVKDPGAVMADEAMFTLGRLYGDLGEKGKRTEILKRLAEQHPDSIYQKIAQEEGA
jgi:TolA-binding protein